MVAHLRLDRLAKSFGPTRAVDGVSLDVEQGEFIALLGPSGCGKTTVMRMISGIVAPDQGSIRLAGRVLDDLPPERRGVGIVFQSYALFPHMTVAENVAFGLKMRGLARVDRDSRVRAALDLVELGELADRLPRALSGGQQQRVALARAIAIEPPLLLLDEPLSNLDAKLREQLRHELKLLQRRLGVTAIHVTHDQSEALAVADRIVVMNQGRIVEAGTPTALYREPRHRFTAEFLGQTNLIPVAAVAGGVRLPDGTRLAANHALADGAPALISIRPEDLEVAVDQQGGGTIDDLVFHGSETEYFVSVPALGRLGRERLRIRVAGAGRAPMGQGTQVSLVFPPQVHVVAVEPMP
jgi:putative spermidine/putrescine transport system ATP-binding protein